MDKYDKDKNSIIEGDEFKSMTNAERSDLNKDGRITLDELMQRVRGEGDGGSARPGRSRGEGEEKAGRNSYRFTSALERIEGSARSWVERYDDNRDGQVSMAEFSTSWTDSKVREFQGYDKNGDGIVTGAEYGAGRSEGRGR
jgi:Ca2+-binding EF-hand superfamily protein